MSDFLLSQPIKQLERAEQVSISYLPEGSTPLGTAGGLYKFRSQIQDGGIDCFFVINSDICADFALPDLLVSHSLHGDGGHLTIMSVKARKEQAVNYGNVLVSSGETKVKHYQEKPVTRHTSPPSCMLLGRRVRRACHPLSLSLSLN